MLHYVVRESSSKVMKILQNVSRVACLRDINVKSVQLNIGEGKKLYYPRSLRWKLGKEGKLENCRVNLEQELSVVLR